LPMESSPRRLVDSSRYAMEFDRLRDLTYNISMNAFRNTVVTITCFALVMPYSAFSPCCCTVGDVARNCTCSKTADDGSCCCSNSTSKTNKTCCSEEPSDSCECSCDCTVPDEPRAVFPPNLKRHVDLAIAPWSIGLLTRAAILSIPHRSRLDRPPISHTRRQATLCVWLK
jgi:hypothetical protein